MSNTEICEVFYALYDTLEDLERKLNDHPQDERIERILDRIQSMKFEASDCSWDLLH